MSAGTASGPTSRRRRLVLPASYLLLVASVFSARFLPIGLAGILPYWPSVMVLLASVFTCAVADTRPAIATREDRWTWILAVLAGGAGFALSLAYWTLVQPGWADKFHDSWRPGLAEALDTAIVGPFFEELLFRGGYWALLAAHRPPAFVVAVTTTLFAVGHLAGTPAPVILPPLFAAGVLLGVVRIHSRSIAPCFVAHATSNALFLLFP